MKSLDGILGVVATAFSGLPCLPCLRVEVGKQGVWAADKL
jgi:hypothetical protein